jgi:hypothetical protein
VLLLGMAGAGVVYWVGTRSADLSDDASMLGYREIDDEFGVGVNAKINVLLAALAVFQFVVSFLAADKGKQFVNLHVWKGNVANALV